MNERHDENSTYEKLLQAGGEVFADRGFKAATIREISQRAGANVAAVNYHFGDKYKLFEAILDRVEQSWHAMIPDIQSQIAQTDDDLKKVTIFIDNIFAWGINRPQWHTRLMDKIFHNSDERLDDIFRPIIQKRFAVICGIIRCIMGSKVDEDTVRLCTLSLISQFGFFLHKPAHAKKHNMHFDLRNPDDLEKIKTHIAQFTLAGINCYRKLK